MRILECVPNISEGRDPGKISSLVNSVAGVSGVKILDVTSDYDHNRTVITFAGEPLSVSDAVVELCKKALSLIDLNNHKGEHPRTGALDVAPFVPIEGVAMKEAVEISILTGERIYRETGIPVYLYENSSERPYRKNLADIRRGGFEGLLEKTKDPLWKPDFGEGFHKTAGVVITGAREFLVAFNFLLNTDDVLTAREVAKSIRESSGGLPCVKALGLYLKSSKQAQVSVNLTDFNKTPLFEVYEAVDRESKKRGARIASTELIGLIPKKAMIDSAAGFLKLKNYDYDKKILENNLERRFFTDEA